MVQSHCCSPRALKLQHVTLLTLERDYIRACYFRNEYCFDKSVPQKQTIAMLNIQAWKMKEEVKRSHKSCDWGDGERHAFQDCSWLTAQTRSTHSKWYGGSPFISAPALSSSSAVSQVEDLTELSFLNCSPRGGETLGKVTAEQELRVLLHISMINSALQFQELSSKHLLPPLKISV